MNTKNPPRFYALTVSGAVYVAELTEIEGEHHPPYLKKLAQVGSEGSKTPVGCIIDNGTMISIGRNLVLFVPEGGGLSSYQRDSSLCNTRYHGGSTSSIIALALTKERIDEIAAEWVAKPSHLDDWPDLRWKTDTIEVLRAVGDDHPRCSITEHYIPGRLMERSDWVPAEERLEELSRKHGIVMVAGGSRASEENAPVA